MLNQTHDVVGMMLSFMLDITLQLCKLCYADETVAADGWTEGNLSCVWHEAWVSFGVEDWLSEWQLMLTELEKDSHASTVESWW